MELVNSNKMQLMLDDNWYFMSTAEFQYMYVDRPSHDWP